jgi:hypothetical protein
MAASEDDWLAFVTARAEAAGWSWRHITRSTVATKRGQVGDHDARDIPDLLLWRPPRFLFRELKKTGGRPTQGQLEFVAAMKACGIDADFWWPRDLERVLEELA